MRPFWMLVLMLGIVPLAAAAPDAEPGLRVAVGTVDLHSGPGADFDAVRLAHRGDLAILLERRLGWLRVRLMNGGEGWIADSFVVPTDANTPPVETEASAPPGRYLALCMGLGQRNNGQVGSIEAADAGSVCELLKRRYGFAVVRTLLDAQATRGGILDALTALAQETHEGDHVFIFFAGKGERNPVTGRGAWIPADGRVEAPSGWLSHAELDDHLRSLRAESTLLVSDALYLGPERAGSSEAVAGVAGATTPTPKPRRSLQAIVSGASGDSPATEGRVRLSAVLIEHLRASAQPRLHAEDLFAALRSRFLATGEPAPELLRISEDGGQFSFTLADGIAATPTAGAVAATPTPPSVATPEQVPTRAAALELTPGSPTPALTAGVSPATQASSTPASSPTPSPTPIATLAATPEAPVSSVTPTGKAQLIVRSNVSGDRLLIDDRNVGATSRKPREVPAGVPMRVRVEKDGYGAWEEEVTLKPNEKKTLTAELEPSGTSDAAREAIIGLSDALADPDVEVRVNAISGLIAAGPGASKAVPDLIQALSDSRPEVRKEAAIVLQWLGPAAAKAADALSTALSDSDSEVRSEAIVALGEIGPEARGAVPGLVAALADPDPYVREEAAFALGKIGPDAKEASTPLRAALQDKEAGVPLYAAFALERLAPSPSGVPVALIRALENPTLGPVAARTLGELGPAAAPAVEALRQALQSDTAELRTWAGIALSKIDPENAEAAVQALIEGLQSADFMQEQVVNGLGRIGTKARAAIPALRQAQKDSNGFVSDAIDDALKQITK